MSCTTIGLLPEIGCVVKEDETETKLDAIVDAKSTAEELQSFLCIAELMDGQFLFPVAQ